jgi:magnesium transporter
MITAYVHQGGETARYGAVDPRWLDPAAGATLWVDLEAPTGDELRVLTDVFHLHQLAVDDARSSLQFPKVEDYQRFVYLVLHAMDVPPGQATVATRDVDFFVGPTYLATVHDGASRTVADVRSGCERHAHFMSEGPVGVLHRVVDALVDNYRPAIDALERAVERVEEEAFASRGQVVRRILRLRRELAAVRRVLIPQRDAVGRLARREFPLISDEMAYRFRDVYDHVIRLADESCCSRTA